MEQRKLSHRLNVQDATFLYFEREKEPLHIGSVAIFEGQVPFDRFVEHLDSRMHLIPRYRQRVIPVPFGLAYPSWQYDPDFHILNHLHRVTLPPPGNQDQLARLAGELFAPPLDRNKPLWEIFLIDGLEGGNSAWLAKVHHCLVDGVAGIDLLMVTLDVSPNPAPPPPPQEPYAPPPLPDRTTVLSEAIWDQLGEFVRNMGELQLNLANPIRYVQRLRHVLGALEVTAPFFRRPAPRVPFNAPLTGRRQIAWTEMSFAEIRGIRSSVGGTINDVVLAIVTGALGRYLRLHGQDTDGLELRFMIPVNVRQHDESTALGNRISAMFAGLPVGIADPIAQLKEVRERVEALKQINQAAGISVVFDLASSAPMALHAISKMTRVPNVLLNLVCTNVPGPMIPLYTVGHRLLAHYPLVPIAWDLGLGVAITSYNQKLYFGLMADAGVMADVHKMKEAVDEAFLELREAAGVPPSDLPTLMGRPAAAVAAPGSAIATEAS